MKEVVRQNTRFDAISKGCRQRMERWGMSLQNDLKLFAVYLGGRALKCNTELHDVVFAVGKSIEDTYAQLLKSWFGSREGLHIDSWLELDVVDGYQVCLSPEPSDSGLKLFFVNLGAYADGAFTEVHENIFLIGSEALAVKRRAKENFLQGKNKLHTDSLFEVDDCLLIEGVQDWYVHLQPTERASTWLPHNDYHVIPQ